MSLSDVANLVEIIGIVAIIFGIAFGALQLRQHRKRRNTGAVSENRRGSKYPERAVGDLGLDLYTIQPDT